MSDGLRKILMVILAIFMAVFMLLGMVFAVSTPIPTGECTGEVAAKADEIERDRPARARATDPKTGVIYLRYNNRLVSVDPNHQPTGCYVRSENLDRVNGGAFIYLGNGFRPSSPSGSSGGSSGSGSSGGGTK